MTSHSKAVNGERGHIHCGLFTTHHLGEQFASSQAQGKALVAAAEGEPQPFLAGGWAWACASSAKYADILREADAIFIEELHNADWYHKTSQAFAVFLPVRSVGVVGDGRRYEWVALRAVEIIDFMTARWAPAV